MNEIASGVYGRIFDDGTGYVYKVFYTECKNNESGWIREIIALKNLSHPNIIYPKFIGFNFAPDPEKQPKSNIYIKLKKYAQLPKLQFPIMDIDILQSLLDLFNGLAYMHSKFIMHRDIKEANLLYEPTEKNNGRQINRLIICDFSLARFTINTDDIGNFNYLTPETITSSHRPPEVFQSIRSNELKGMRRGKIEYNEKVDVWSAGIVMFYLLTGIQLYSVIFSLEKKNQNLLDFIHRTPSLNFINKRWDVEERDKIYTELLLSDYSTVFIKSLLDKYINKNLTHLNFYKELFCLCISDVDKRPSAVSIVNKLTKFILTNDINDINDCGILGNALDKIHVTRYGEIDRHIFLFMNDAVGRINSKNVRGLILNKISIIMSKFCEKINRSITEIDPKYIIAAAHIIEIMFLYEDIFTVYFKNSRDTIYKYMSDILIETDFLGGLFI